MNPWWWTIIFAFFCLNAAINRWNNLYHGGMWFWLSWLIACVPVFTIIGLYSTNILFDSLLYDILIFFAYLIVMVLMGCGSTFTILNWLGLSLTIIGFILMKV